MNIPYNANSQLTHLSDKKVRDELFEAIADIVPKSCFVELMTGQKVRAEKSQIKLPTLIEFAESFIDGCDPELDVSSLTEMFAHSVSLTSQQIIQYTSKKSTSQNRHFGLTKDMVE